MRRVATCITLATRQAMTGLHVVLNYDILIITFEGNEMNIVRRQQLSLLRELLQLRSYEPLGG